MAPDVRNPADMHVNCHDRNWVWKATLLVPASSDEDEIKRRCVHMLSCCRCVCARLSYQLHQLRYILCRISELYNVVQSSVEVVIFAVPDAGTTAPNNPLISICIWQPRKGKTMRIAQ
jgi:hypothetical protein